MIPSSIKSFSMCKGFLWHELYKTVMLLALAITAAFPASAQLPAGGNGGQVVAPAPASAASKPTATSKLTFDAASIRPSAQKFFLKGWDFLDPLGEIEPPKGGLFSWNVQLISLIAFAYDVRSPQMGRGVWEGLPKWAQDNWYTVEARAEGNPTRADVLEMVRSMLEERFQFAGHREKRDGQVYSLVVAKPGLGLKPHPEGAPCALSTAQVDENRYPHAYPAYKQDPVQCGIFNRELSHVGERRLEMLNVTMQQIADTLGGQSPLSVVDKTGLAGRYDAVVDFGSGGVPPDANSSDEIGLPPLPGALEKQLGLKLVKQNATVDVFVLDHIGPLSEN
jgi:uncharacterized protein (TIGR03435 family)